MKITSEPTQLTPRFKARNDDHGLHLAIALPGITKEEVEISLSDRLLTLHAQRKPLEGDFENLNQEAQQLHLKLRLHPDLDPTSIKATQQNGLLTLTLKKRKELTPRKIDILAN